MAQGLGSRELAYLGDAVFELMVREKLVAARVPFSQLNGLADKLVCAKAQADMYHSIFTKLTKTEQAMIKRGRNLRGSAKAKTACMSDYRHATGLEVLFGYLHANGEWGRLEQIFELCVDERIST